jgi:hypothetical protein
MTRCATIVVGFLLLLAASTGLAQDVFGPENHLVGLSSFFAARADGAAGNETVSSSSSSPDLAVPAPASRMSPDLALTTYLRLASSQLTDLGAYSDKTTIEADLPDTSQHGRYELRRSFQAPKTLAYAAVHFAGDGFVKTNVIIRLLQSEVDHVQKGEGQLTAITSGNYKFSWKGVDTLDGRTFYRYQVKPRQKRPGLFKGFILVDAATGQLRRAEGAMIKSPSFFVKKLEFVQDYAAFGQFSLPVHVHSVAKTRLVGRAVVDISHDAYQAKSLSEVQSEARSSSAAAGGSSSNN